MALSHEIEPLMAALRTVPGVQSVVRGWPKAKEKLPCIAVNLASEVVLDYRDDRRYLMEVEFYLRLFTAQATQADALRDAIDDLMLSQGYELTMAYDDDSEQIRMSVFRYRKAL